MKTPVIFSAAIATFAQTTASDVPKNTQTEGESEAKDKDSGILQMLKAEGILTTGTVVADARTGSRTTTRNA